MAQNDFKSFAVGAGANVTSQADWEAQPALITGFQSGKASSAQINKAIRQASFIAAALAQYTSDKTGGDVLDDGDQAAFITKMAAAFGKDFQPLDATLTALAALTGATDKLPYFNGADSAALTALTGVGRDIIGKATTDDVLTYLGLGDLVNALIKTNNLSDLPDKAVSRTNLGAPAGVDKQMCTAWVRFNASGTTNVINDSFNVSSVTRTSAGNNTVVFATPMANANYSFSYTVGGTGDAISIGSGSNTAPSVASLNIISTHGGATGSGTPIEPYGFSVNSVNIYGGR